MKTASFFTVLALLSSALLPAAEKAKTCECGSECGKDGASCCCVTAVAETPAPASHPVKGVVKSILPEKTALMVKHEEVPGVMRAMTMMFKVDAAVLAKVQPGDAIKARMSRRADGWWLTEVELVPAAKN